MIEAIGGRKFVGFMVILVLLFALVILSKITGAEFVAFITANFGVYVAGNVGDAIASKNNTNVITTSTAK